ncbi:MAG TPA: hypothetical protein VFA10_14460 [Ktedonobacteraceae bacterium]|nr:hypothetical protein [Ktedonobacteraceae bacterium]
MANAALPHFREHGDDHLIPLGYGIDCSHDGGYYPYKVGDTGLPIYLKDTNGLDIRYPSYKQVREHLAEIVD